MAGIDFGGGGRWNPDDSYDERNVGGWTGGASPVDSGVPSGSLTSPGRPVAVQTANDWVPSSAQTPAGQRWDPNVAGFVPNNIPNDPTGYVMSGGQLVGKSNPSARVDGGGGNDPRSLFSSVFAKYNLDPNNPGHGLAGVDYFLQRLSQTNPNDVEYWAGANKRIEQEIRQALYGEKGNLIDTGGGNAPGSPVPGMGYDDPSSLLYLNELFNRLNALKQPRADPANDQLAQLIQSLVAKSKQAPYTAGEDAALTARYMNPLTQARDSAIRQNTEEASHRGYLPSSGLLRRQNTDTRNAYTKAVGSASNDLAVRAVDEQQNRALQAIQALGGLVQNNRVVQDRQDNIDNQVVTLASLFPQFDEGRLSMLLNASNETPGAAISGLTQLGSLGLAGQNNANNQAANSATSWADFLYRLSQTIHK